MRGSMLYMVVIAAIVIVFLSITSGMGSSQEISFTQVVSKAKAGDIQSMEVDGENIPIRHFGVILTYNKWDELVKRLEKEKINFLIKPQIRFKGVKGEQKTFFIKDPDGNALEFKTFKNDSNIFKH